MILLIFVAGFLTGKWFFNPPNEAKMIFATYNGGQIRGQEVLDLVQRDLNQLEKNKYNIKKLATEQLIRERTQQPDTMNESSDWSKQQISKEELGRFLKERNLTESKLSKKEKENILNNMKLQKMLEQKKHATQAQLENLSIRYKIPRQSGRIVSVSKGSVQPRGPSSAPITLVHFANFHCPSCSMAQQNLSALNAKYPDKIKTYFRFQLRDSEDSIVFKTAEAALCANDDGKFWEYHDLVQQNPPVKDADLIEAAKKINLKTENFSKCLNSRQHKNDIQHELDDANKIDGIAEPFFIINGELVAGQAPIDELSVIVDSQLP